MATTLKSGLLGGLIVGLSVAAVPASAAFTGYLKLPDIEGEKDRRSAGDEHEIEYDIVMAPAASASADQEGHAELYDLRWGTRVSTERADTIPLQNATVGSVRQTQLDTPRANAATATAPARLASRAGSDQQQGHRRQTPVQLTRRMSRTTPEPVGSGAGSVAVALPWAGCEVGARYPHVNLGDGHGKEYRLDNVTVAACSDEEVSLAFEGVQVRYEQQADDHSGG